MQIIQESDGLQLQAQEGGMDRGEISDTPLLRSKPANPPKPPPKPAPPALSEPMPPPEKTAPSPEKAARVIAAAAPPPRKRNWLHLAGLLLLFGIGGIGYYGYTEYLQDLMNQPVIPPPPRLPPTQAESPVAAASPPEIQKTSLPASPSTPPPPSATPELKPAPPAAPEIKPETKPEAKPAAEAPRQPAPVEEATAPPKKSGVAAKPINSLPPESLQIRRNEAVGQLNQTLQRAYAAYQAGDRKTARNAYLQVLVGDSRNRDALLGLAGLAILDKDAASARRYYREVLRLFPGDAPAQAGLLSLESQPAAGSETDLKLALAQNPNAGYLHFQLGNLYSGQQRWAEAQQAYFDAHRADPNQPDYAFNLAVSLERLNQPKAALEFYRQALQLAASRPAGFSSDSARQRIAALSPAAPVADSAPSQPLP
jgi:tetratricopeptide (TPR) repeat protein